jgi:hypothetical protein
MRTEDSMARDEHHPNDEPLENGPPVQLKVSPGTGQSQSITKVEDSLGLVAASGVACPSSTTTHPANIPGPRRSGDRAENSPDDPDIAAAKAPSSAAPHQDRGGSPNQTPKQARVARFVCISDGHRHLAARRSQSSSCVRELRRRLSTHLLTTLWIIPLTVASLSLYGSIQLSGHGRRARHCHQSRDHRRVGYEFPKRGRLRSGWRAAPRLRGRFNCPGTVIAAN